MDEDASAGSTSHIFMSFNLHGTAATFADQIYAAFKSAGLRTYKGKIQRKNEEYDRSESKEIIKQSNSSLIIFSNDYALFPKCLDELVIILNRKKESNHRILPVYYDVKPSDLRKHRGKIGDAFRLYEQEFEAEMNKKGIEKVTLWKKALEEAADLAGLVFPNMADGHEAEIIIRKIVRVMVRSPVIRFFNGCTHHIYMSFNLHGTATTFADHLYASFTKAGLYTYRARSKINKECDTWIAEKIIRQSNSSLIIFTKDYALSPTCLDELVMILNHIKESDHRVIPVYYDVDPSDIRKQLGRIGEAFRLHDQKFESEADSERRIMGKEKLKLWRIALKEAADIAGLVVPNVANGHEAKVIEKIVKVMEDKVSRVIFKGHEPLVGMYSRANNVNLWLQDDDS